MSAATSHYVKLLGREVHYLQWGRPGAPLVILWHGFARNAHDFTELAEALAGDYWLVAPDTIGRGLSQWSPDPVQEYSVPFYAGQAIALVQHLGVDSLRWVGTSMGGLIGMAVAAGPLKDRISHLVLNDVGPEIAPGAVQRILSYAGKPPSFASLTELEAYFRSIYAPFGIAADATWRRMAETSCRRLPDGSLTTHYDPRIATVMAEQAGQAAGDAWPIYDLISAPTLLLRGAVSDLLSPQTAQAMTQRGPRAKLQEIAGIGHAPALDRPDQIALIAEFLR
ncbi:alpha/beta hydrolase [Ferrovibrio sp.]|uniref:alpha/beta fold hydrolase n=1 Tax=Ferrovibrio sp. TaxID=1917215 RepID=UPI0025C2A376|nr:alpha/beta hydrolase [Ferrovibrio sp.]MBX3455845.1 alpha/beta hydrolase [Ferrovibrio sp.]